MAAKLRLDDSMRTFEGRVSTLPKEIADYLVNQRRTLARAYMFGNYDMTQELRLRAIGFRGKGRADIEWFALEMDLTEVIDCVTKYGK